MTIPPEPELTYRRVGSLMEAAETIESGVVVNVERCLLCVHGTVFCVFLKCGGVVWIGRRQSSRREE